MLLIPLGVVGFALVGSASPVGVAGSRSSRVGSSNRPSVRCPRPSPPRRNAFPNRRQQRILIAVAWPYASGPRHLGHVAGFGVPSDITARYHRLRGDDVLMVSGTDEHGTPVMVAADREGLSAA